MSGTAQNVHHETQQITHMLLNLTKVFCKVYAIYDGLSQKRI